jgi:hypothetical protein
VVGREDLAEGHRRRQARDRGDVAVVDAELSERVVEVLAERVLAGAGDDRAAPAVTGGGHRHVGGAAAQVLPEGLDRSQRHPDLERVDVDADAPHREDVERDHLHGAASPTMPRAETLACQVFRRYCCNDIATAS